MRHTGLCLLLLLLILLIWTPLSNALSLSLSSRPPSESSRRPSESYRLGVSSFLSGDAASSLLYFDEMPSSPGLWQRGLAAYAAGDYQKAREQFRLDRTANGGDGEETIWEVRRLECTIGVNRSKLE